MLGAARVETKKTNCLKGSQVSQPIGGGSGSGMGTREMPLTVVSCRFHRVSSARNFPIYMHGRGWASRVNLQAPTTREKSALRVKLRERLQRAGRKEHSPRIVLHQHTLSNTYTLLALLPRFCGVLAR
jgi:hypothetical protein